MAYVVIWPKAKINVDGVRTLCVRGELVPDGVDPSQLATLASIGAIAQVDDLGDEVDEVDAQVVDAAISICSECLVDGVETEMVADDECGGGHLCPIHDATHVHDGDGPDADFVAELLQGNVETILDTVDDDADLARAALEAEQSADKPRKTLVEGLEAVLTAAEQGN